MGMFKKEDKGIKPISFDGLFDESENDANKQNEQLEDIQIYKGQILQTDYIYLADLKKATIVLYKNRIEIKHKGLVNAINKGRSGNLTIYLKHLEGIEFDEVLGLLQFITPSFEYIKQFNNQLNADNCILFNQRNEVEDIRALIYEINELI